MYVRLPGLLVPARLVSHAPYRDCTAPSPFAGARSQSAHVVRPSVYPSHAHAHASRQSYFNIIVIVVLTVHVLSLYRRTGAAAATARRKSCLLSL